MSPHTRAARRECLEGRQDGSVSQPVANGEAIGTVCWEVVTVSARCLACLSPKRQQIDEFLARGASIRDTAQRFGLSRSSVARHRGHMADLVPIAQPIMTDAPESLVDTLKRILVDARRVAGLAESAEEYGAAVAALREQARIAEIVVRVHEAQAERDRSSADDELTDAELVELRDDVVAEIARRQHECKT